MTSWETLGSSVRLHANMSLLRQRKLLSSLSYLGFGRVFSIYFHSLGILDRFQNSGQRGHGRAERCGWYSEAQLSKLSRGVSHPVLGPNQMVIVCVPRNQVYTHTVQKMDTE
jgi:hypothetical protein